MNLLRKWRRNQSGQKAMVQRRHGREEQEPLADWRLSRLREQIDRTFDRLWRDLDRGEAGPLSRLPGWSAPPDWPAVDVAEDDKAVTVRADVPGMQAQDLDIEVSGNLLTIRGSREDEWSDRHGGIYRQERRVGCFARTITLPSYVDADKVEAKYDKGTLTITVPKQPGKGPKRVPVHG